MVWTIEEFSYLFDAPYPATKGELIEYAERIGAPPAVIQNLQALEEEDGVETNYHSPEEISPELGGILGSDPYSDGDNDND